MDEHIDLHIGQRLKSRRRALRLTQSDLGAMTAITFRQIHKYECGENRMSAATLWKLACALGVDMQHFYEGLRDETRPAAGERAAEDGRLSLGEMA